MPLESSPRPMQPAGGCLLTFPVRPQPEAILSVDSPLPQLNHCRQSPPRHRRSHRKSRAGCRTCKARRVKCDETRPQCRRCQTYGIACDFASTADDAGLATPPRTFPRRNGALALDAMAASVDAVLESGRHSPVPATPTPSLGLSTLAHFVEMVGARQTAYAHIKRVMRDRTIPLALTVSREHAASGPPLPQKHVTHSGPPGTLPVTGHARRRQHPPGQSPA